MGDADEYVQLEWNVWGEERETLVTQLTELR